MITHLFGLYIAPEIIGMNYIIVIIFKHFHTTEFFLNIRA